MSANNLPFHSAITDEGICDVLNGDTLRTTFSKEAVPERLGEAVDPRQFNICKLFLEHTYLP